MCDHLFWLTWPVTKTQDVYTWVRASMEPPHIISGARHMKSGNRRPILLPSRATGQLLLLPLVAPVSAVCAHSSVSVYVWAFCVCLHACVLCPWLTRKCVLENTAGMAREEVLYNLGVQQLVLGHTSSAFACLTSARQGCFVC